MSWHQHDSRAAIVKKHGRNQEEIINENQQKAYIFFLFGAISLYARTCTEKNTEKYVYGVCILAGGNRSDTWKLWK